MATTTLLIIDDEKSIRESLSGIIADEGFTPLTASSAEDGLELLDQQDVDLVLLDIWMPGMDGLKALEEIKKKSDIPVIMISGHGTIETAVQATRIGAFDFIEKPLSYDKTMLSITKGLHVSRLERENRILRDSTPSKPELTGKSPVIVQLREQIDLVAPTDASVLILGGHGTGKELVAQNIHSRSSRSEQPMIEVNCAAIPEELIESELFGHVKGAFTGATSNRQGKFDQAHKSTLFLDEIGDMSLKSQAKVLRILQEQKFERVGGGKTINVDVRILAATNKNLEAEIEENTFRADLFYRLNVVPIVVPELHERIEDIPLLVDDFLRQFRAKGLGRKEFTSEAVHALMHHSWPGNVRELKNFVERAMIMAPGESITKKDVALFLGTQNGTAPPAGRNQYSLYGFKEAKKQFERDYLIIKLRENKGNISQTAEHIGMERSHLHKKLKSLQIDEFTRTRKE
jgi:two-component system nitrogen regulation response regulator NtrX